MGRVSDLFFEFQILKRLVRHLGHVEDNVPLRVLRDELGVDITRAVVNVPQDSFPWFEHRAHWSERRLPTGPSNGRAYEGYVLAPTKDPDVFCLVRSKHFWLKQWQS